MAEKNWLIRTKNKQILGPATKQKIIELIEKGSLTGEDEVSSGNGYWFWIKETDLLDKYIYGNEVQTFNPISEAESVLSNNGVSLPISLAPSPSKQTQKNKPVSAPPPKPAPAPKSNESLFPDDEDLEYPDMEVDLSHEDKTGEIDLGEMQEDESAEDEDDVTRLDLSDLSGQIAAMKAETSDLVESNDEDADLKEEIPQESDLEYPEIDSEESSGPPDISAAPPKKKPLFRKKMTEKPEFQDSEENDEVAPMTSPVKMTKQRNDKYLFFIFILAFFLIAVVFYYYRMVLNKPIPLVGISEAHAQTIKPLPITISKKKTFLKLKI